MPTARPETQRGSRAAAAPPRFVEFQHPRTVARAPSGPGWVHEIKYDGYRVQVRIEAGRATLTTRAAQDWTGRFPEIAEACETLPDGLIDGEVCALDAEGRPDFEALRQAMAQRATGALVLFAFDLLFQGARDLRGRPLIERKAALARLLSGADPARIRLVEHFEAAGPAMLASACRMGLEGIVSKRAASPYRSGERSDAWQKSKCEQEVDVVIVGWRGEYGRLGSLLAAAPDGGRLRYAGRIETGFSPDRDAELMRRLEALETPRPPAELVDAPPRAPNTHWARPELAAVVNITGVTADGKLRHGSAFKDWRERPTPSSAPATQASGPPPAPRAGVAPRNRRKGVLGVEIPNPEGLAIPGVGPQPGITRLALARYVAEMADEILPYVRGRPCSVLLPPVRPPRIDDYERHAGQGKSTLAAAPEVSLVHLPATGKTYFEFDLPAALVAAVAHGGLEFHPWQCLEGDPGLPGRFVIDLDPGEGVAFAAVARAALEVRDRLARVGLASWPKTTGGRGLHVVAPFRQDADRPIGWAAAKGFCRALCEAMAADSPGTYTVSLKKADRTGRIFLDYLRNGRTNTAIAVLSPRLRPGAPVSMPLNWDQVSGRLDPAAFTVRTAPAAIAAHSADRRHAEGSPGALAAAMAAFRA